MLNNFKNLQMSFFQRRYWKTIIKMISRIDSYDLNFPLSGVQLSMRRCQIYNVSSSIAEEVGARKN